MKRGLLFYLFVILLVCSPFVLSEHSADVSLTSNPDMIYEFNEAEIFVSVENLPNSTNNIDKIVFESENLNITGVEISPGWTAVIEGGGTSVEWEEGCIYVRFTGVFVLNITVNDLLSDQIEEIKIRTEDTEGDSQLFELNLNLLDDSLAPRYSVNSPQNHSIIKPQTILFNVSVTEQESGLASTTMFYDWFDSVGVSESPYEIDLNCDSSDCSASINNDDGSDNKYFGYYFEIMDLSGNKDYTNYTDANWFYFYVDDLAPSVSFVSTLPETTNQNIHQFYYDLTENTFDIDSSFDSSVKCEINLINSSGEFLVGSNIHENNVENTEINASLSVSGGIYQGFVNCTDNAGWFDISESKNITIDRTGPGIILTSHNNYAVIDNNTSIVFSVEDILSAVDSVWWVLEGIDISLGENPILSSINFSIGLNNIQIYANDSLGNIANVNFTIYVDTQGPEISLDYPDNNTSTIGRIQFTPKDDYSSSLICSLYVDDVLDQTGTVVNNIETNWTVQGNFDNILYSWYVTCIDEANNMGSSETRTLIFNFTSSEQTSNDGGGGGGSDSNFDDNDNPKKEKPLCNEEWSCDAWGDCLGGIQKRNCQEIGCDTGLKIEEKECKIKETEDLETNLDFDENKSKENEETGNPLTGAATRGAGDIAKDSVPFVLVGLASLSLIGLGVWKRKSIFGNLHKIIFFRKIKREKEEAEVRSKLRKIGII